ncbi:ASCH domain-containing protein [Lacticaseibacillus jixianensis]|uniref:ASCH domain-containing protein n=1 Tax=Lacticaseibacillus jixianensis TaxID=2486012 RepID=A0ABW4BED2_9LACO|nr:ASCH domain-containing protein [Lacticaseibacillus jixianensis]
MDMAITHDQFKLIQAGTKTIEVRLNDAKRRALRPGNHITFNDLEDGSRLRVAVAAIDHFPSFAALYTAYPGLQVGAAAHDSVAKMTKDTYQHYTPAQEQANGVLAIHLAL